MKLQKIKKIKLFSFNKRTPYIVVITVIIIFVITSKATRDFFKQQFIVDKNNAAVTKTRTLMLAKTKMALEEAGIPFFLSSDSFLDRYKDKKYFLDKCDIEIGVFAKDYNDEIITKMYKNGMVMSNMKGDIKTGLHLAFFMPTSGVQLHTIAKVHIILHYTLDNEKKIYWVIYNGDTPIKYTVNEFSLQTHEYAGAGNILIPIK
jgi:hypothetical protein